MNNNLKLLTGKNPSDFEPVAYSLINNSDEALFSELVQNEDFLFDFVKQNVANRLAKVCNESNYLNLLKFLKYYSPSYEEFIVSTLAKYADEDLTDKMLEIFENGTDNEKAYCAKFFSYVQDSLALELLKENAWSENTSLSTNCARTLACFGDKDLYNKAIEMLSDKDEFTKLDGVKFLSAYGDKSAVPEIIDAMKTTSMPENFAGELLYLVDMFSLYNSDRDGALFVLNSVLNGLGEILPLGCIFDFELYNIFDMLIKEDKISAIALVLYNALDKFLTLTENDEYLFDETKEVKQEVKEVKQLLESIDKLQMLKLLDEELKEDSNFVFTALEFSKNKDKVRGLLASAKPAIVVKALETLKHIDYISESDRNTALGAVNDENLKNVILAI